VPHLCSLGSERLDVIRAQCGLWRGRRGAKEKGKSGLGFRAKVATDGERRAQSADNGGCAGHTRTRRGRRGLVRLRPRRSRLGQRSHSNDCGSDRRLRGTQCRRRQPRAELPCNDVRRGRQPRPAWRRGQRATNGSAELAASAHRTAACSPRRGAPEDCGAAGALGATPRSARCSGAAPVPAMTAATVGRRRKARCDQPKAIRRRLRSRRSERHPKPGGKRDVWRRCTG